MMKDFLMKAPNLSIIFKDILIDKKIDSEEYVIEDMKADGYQCMKTTEFKRRWEWDPNFIKEVSCVNKRIFDICCIISKGCPDLICWKRNEWFMLEVKTCYDESWSD